MNKLLEYLPNYYINNKEMQITTEAKVPEIKKLWESVAKVRDNQFINTMDSDRIRQWERLLKIRPDFNTQSLEYRREVVLLRLNTAPPFTERWLINLLEDRIAKGKYYIGLDYNNYLLTLNIIHNDPRMVNEIRTFLRRTIPANLTLNVKRVEIQEADQVQIIKVGVTKTLNNHMSIPVKRTNRVQKIQIIKVGITKTLVRHLGG
jgi:hypothetical protein